MNRRILHLAIPSIVSNITVPLLGLVDVTIVGHLGATAYIGAIAVGGLLFNILYWNFGFLRMGTSGLTSQAYGRKDKDAEIRVLVQAVSVGLFSALEQAVVKHSKASMEIRLFDYWIQVRRWNNTRSLILEFVFGGPRRCWHNTVSRGGLSECKIPVTRCILPL